jgi:hypothetical protein
VVYDPAKSDEQTKILKFIFKSTEFGRITLVPPGVPAARAKALREAFWAAATSDRLRKDAERRKMAIDPHDRGRNGKDAARPGRRTAGDHHRAIASMHR